MAKRNQKGQFSKGVSGNPSGRRAVAPEVREFLSAHTLSAAERLVELLASDDGNIALKAANSILDRVHGKPEQAHKLEGLEGMRAVVLIKDLRGGGGADG